MSLDEVCGKKIKERPRKSWENKIQECLKEKNIKFNAAAESVRALKSRPTDTELLELYALFKQATVGDCNTDRPGLTDLKGKAKWDVWNGKKGMSQDAAKEEYVSYANTLITKY